MEYPYNSSSFPLSPHETPNYGFTQSPDGPPASANHLLSQVSYTAPVPVLYALGPYGRDQSAYDAVLTPAGSIKASTSSDTAQGNRKMSVTQDNESESSQSLRRRAQNRASQRAFRERQNQRVADLEVQLKDSCINHEGLRQSYEREADKVASMKRKIEELKAEIELLNSSNDCDAVFGRPRVPEQFDTVSGPGMPACHPFLEFDLDLDRRFLDTYSDLVVSQLD